LIDYASITTFPYCYRCISVTISISVSLLSSRSVFVTQSRVSRIIGRCTGDGDGYVGTLRAKLAKLRPEVKSHIVTTPRLETETSSTTINYMSLLGAQVFCGSQGLVPTGYPHTRRPNQHEWSAPLRVGSLIVD